MDALCYSAVISWGRMEGKGKKKRGEERGGKEGGRQEVNLKYIVSGTG